jgi:hypothetical protein
MDTEFGWINLKNRNDDAGFIYFFSDSQPLEIPRLSSKQTYIVMSVHISHVGEMLSILRNEGPLQIRFFDPETAGVNPSAFIEPAVSQSSDTKLIKSLSDLKTKRP